MKRIAIILLASALSWASTPETRKVYGKPRQDAALVYLYRQSHWMAGAAWAMHVFSDDQLVAVLRNNTYTFTYVAPGTHLFWNDGGSAGPCDFAAGQTYYLSFDLDVMSILSEAAGQAAIQKATRFIALDDRQRAKAAGAIAREWSTRKEEHAAALERAEVATYTRPASTENMIQVPAGTALPAELMENLTSALDREGAVV